jgi:FkbH-like protein
MNSPEAVRLVIWDLDGTFWTGTVTEGGLQWRDESEHAVRTLAARGIISAICSKNDIAVIDDILREHGMQDFFVFNSVSWEPKGPRLAALIAAIQLRPENVLFIDDNPANLAEAAHFVPGIQVAGETVIPRLLDDARCQGKPDPALTRLARYQVLQIRQRERGPHSSCDGAQFLRGSEISVQFEYDVGAHAERAIELINRTNQLNFTKTRLPEDPGAARRELMALLAEHNVQAAVLRVRDKYGDHGICGIYIMRNRRGAVRKLLHFAFSCRILGMGVETWLYRKLGHPRITIAAPVVTDILAISGDIDWIAVTGDAAGQAGIATAEPRLTYVLARGGCDMRALSHYFGIMAERVIEEVDMIRGEQMPLVNHSLIAVQAMRGIAPEAVADFAPLGFLAEDFRTVLAGPLPPGPAIWLLSFTIESGVPIFKHRATGALLPGYPKGIGPGGDAAALMRGEAVGHVNPAVTAHLRAHFDFAGYVPDADFRDALQTIYAKAGQDVTVFVLLSNTRTLKAPLVAKAMRQQNAAVIDVASAFPNVHPIDPLDFMSAQELAGLKTPHHYDRMVYYRIFQHIMSVIAPTHAP